MTHGRGSKNIPTVQYLIIRVVPGGPLWLLRTRPASQLVSLYMTSSRCHYDMLVLILKHQNQPWSIDVNCNQREDIALPLTINYHQVTTNQLTQRGSLACYPANFIQQSSLPSAMTQDHVSSIDLFAGDCLVGS